MIGICNQLAPETPSDTLPVTSVALCKEFRRIMGEIGITPETLMLYRQESGNAELDPAAGETLEDAKLSDYQRLYNAPRSRFPLEKCVRHELR